MDKRYVDIGVNLGNRRFDRDREAVIERALSAGVTAMILTGTDLAESEAMASLAANYPGTLWSTAGVHPHDAAGCDEATVPALRRLAARPSVVAVGECGLDFNRDFSPRPAQEYWFQQQLALACELQMPLFLHERDATERMLALLDAVGDALPPAVIHCFTGSSEALDAYLARGLFIGITGWICDERRGGPLREIVGRIPLEKLLVETDAPYLPPRDLRPRVKRNEPAHLPHIASVLATLMEEPVEALARATYQNARRLFRLEGSL